MKTHQLVGNNNLVREATDFFFYKYIHQMLDDGEKVMNTIFTNNMRDEYLRPNVTIKVELIDLSWMTSAEESYNKHKKKGVILYVGTIQNTSRLLEYFIKWIEELHLHIKGKLK